MEGRKPAGLVGSVLEANMLREDESKQPPLKLVADLLLVWPKAKESTYRVQ